MLHAKALGVLEQGTKFVFLDEHLRNGLVIAVHIEIIQIAEHAGRLLLDQPLDLALDLCVLAQRRQMLADMLQPGTRLQGNAKLVGQSKELIEMFFAESQPIDAIPGVIFHDSFGRKLFDNSGIDDLVQVAERTLPLLLEIFPDESGVNMIIHAALPSILHIFDVNDIKCAMTHSDRKTKSGDPYTVLTRISLFVSIPIALFFCLLLFANPGEISDPDAIYTEEINYFAVNMGSYQSQSEAEQFADRIRLRGGAGYVVKEKGYHVLAAVYRSREACENVIENLQKAKNECSLYTITLPRTALVDTLDRQSFERAYGLFFECVDTIYDIIIQLDTYEIENDQACELLLSLAKTLDPSFLKSDMISIKCKAELTALSSSLQATANNPPDNLSVSLKYTEFQILYNLKAMLAEIAK